MPHPTTASSVTIVRFRFTRPRSMHIDDPQSLLSKTLIRNLRSILATASPASPIPKARSGYEVLIRWKKPLDAEGANELLAFVRDSCKQLLETGRSVYPVSLQHSFDLAVKYISWDDSGHHLPQPPVPKENRDTVSAANPEVKTHVSHDIAENAENILKDLDRATKPILARINAWLTSLEGRTFPIDHPADDIDLIRQVVRRAGCQLFYQERPVQIRPVRQATGRFLTIQVRALGKAIAGTLYAAKAFPRLSARPFQKSLD